MYIPWMFDTAIVLINIQTTTKTFMSQHICDPLSENPAVPTNVEFELEAILSVQVVFQLRKLTLLHQRVTGGLYCIILNYEAWFCY